MRLSITVIACIISLLSSTVFAAANCENIIFDINTSIQKHADDFDKQAFQWENFSWLQKHLGGSMHDPKAPQKYTFRCDSVNYLTVTVDQNENLTLVDGAYSSARGAGVFSQTIPLNSINTARAVKSMPKPVGHDMTIHTSAAASKADVNKSMAQAEEDFQNWFNMKVPKDKLVIVTKKMLKSFYDDLQACKAGKYDFPAFNNLFRDKLEDGKLQAMITHGTATISGFSNGKCTVAMTTDMSDPSRGHTCVFNQEGLDALVNMKIGSGVAVSKNIRELQSFNKIMSESCLK
jgi:hypothetical protein